MPALETNVDPRSDAFRANAEAMQSLVADLRAKVEEDPKKPRFIRTVWGVGYRWAGS